MRKDFLLLAAAVVVFAGCGQNNRKQAPAPEPVVEVTPEPEEAPDPYNGHKWVDMGTGIKWAVTNVGAQKPEEAGDYFSWAEVNVKDTYDDKTYLFGSDLKITKYVTISNYNHSGFYDEIGELEPMDDAARAQWGGTWRTPSDKEFKDLLAACDQQQTELEGQKGVLLTSKTTGEQLFFPSAGHKEGTQLLGAGQAGYYWSSTLYTVDPSCARSMSIKSGKLRAAYDTRYFGAPVRPVTE